jgi:hypothetical protein
VSATTVVMSRSWSSLDVMIKILVELGLLTGAKSVQHSIDGKNVVSRLSRFRLPVQTMGATRCSEGDPGAKVGLCRGNASGSEEPPFRPNPPVPV